LGNRFSVLILGFVLEFLKVIVGAHAVMANGGVIAPVGLNMVALAAQRHAVPFVVLAGTHKVIWCYNSSTCSRDFNERQNSLFKNHS
jgi:translation initiation factor 2B subunit (eIF-2B alpha/beta/delta family)